MNQGEFMRLVDAAARERGLDKKIIIDHIERALIQAAQKRFDAVGDFTLTIDRETGEIRAFEDDKPVELERLGRNPGVVGPVSNSISGPQQVSIGDYRTLESSRHQVLVVSRADIGE